MAVDRDFYWNDFNKEVIIRLNNNIKYLHMAFDKRNDCIYNITENKDKYEKYGVNISHIYTLDNRLKIYISRKQKAALGVKLCSYITSYNYLVYEKIPLLEKSIKVLNAIRDYPRDMYNTLQSGLTHEIAKHLLKGNHYSFGHNLGSIRIWIKKFDKDELIERINWFKSFGFRNELIKKGYTPKSKDNPEGVEWRIHHTKDSVAFIKFKLSYKPCINAKYYKFDLGYSHEMCKNTHAKACKSVTALKDKSFQEILDDRNLNCMNKLAAICSNFGNLKYELYWDVANLKKNKI